MDAHASNSTYIQIPPYLHTYITMAANAFPPGGTYFDNGKRSFTDVPIDQSKDNAIATTEFLEAAEALTGLFDVLGSVAFKPVKSDVEGNVTVSIHIPHNQNPCRKTTELKRDLQLHRKSATANSPPPSTAKLSNPSSSTNSKQNRTRHPKVCSG